MENQYGFTVFGNRAILRSGFREFTENRDFQIVSYTKALTYHLVSFFTLQLLKHFEHFDRSNNFYWLQMQK